MKTLSIKPGDLIETPDHRGFHIYSVAAIFLGAEKQESVVELVPLDQTRPSEGAKTVHPLVPVSMIEAGCAARIFRHTDKADFDRSVEPLEMPRSERDRFVLALGEAAIALDCMRGLSTPNEHHRDRASRVIRDALASYQ